MTENPLWIDKILPLVEDSNKIIKSIFGVSYDFPVNFEAL